MGQWAKGQSGNPAGRPRKAEKYAGPIAAAEDQIADLLPELIELQLELARGVTIQEIDQKTGGLKIYTRAPDRQAIEYLVNRILGRPTEQVEALVETDGTLTIRVEYADPHDSAAAPAPRPAADTAGGEAL